MIDWICIHLPVWLYKFVADLVIDAHGLILLVGVSSIIKNLPCIFPKLLSLCKKNWYSDAGEIEKHCPYCGHGLPERRIKP